MHKWHDLQEIIRCSRDSVTVWNTPRLLSWLSVDNSAGCRDSEDYPLRYLNEDHLGGRSSASSSLTSRFIYDRSSSTSSNTPNPRLSDLDASIFPSNYTAEPHMFHSHVQSEPPLGGPRAPSGWMLSQIEPEEHRYRGKLVPRLRRLAGVLLKCYHTSPVDGTHQMELVKGWVEKPEFTDLLRIVCTRPIRQELLPALRPLCHLKALFHTSFSKLHQDADASASSLDPKKKQHSNPDIHAIPVLSTDPDPLEPIQTFASSPVFDLDGRVLWEVVLPTQQALCKQARLVPPLTRFPRSIERDDHIDD